MDEAVAFDMIRCSPIMTFEAETTSWSLQGVRLADPRRPYPCANLDEYDRNSTGASANLRYRRCRCATGHQS